MYQNTKLVQISPEKGLGQIVEELLKEIPDKAHHIIVVVYNNELSMLNGAWIEVNGHKYPVHLYPLPGKKSQSEVFVGYEVTK